METIRKSPMLPPREVNLSPWTSPHTLSGATWLESNRGIHAPWLQASERWSPHYWQSSREPWLGLPGFPGSTAGLATVVARSELDMGLSLSCSIFYVREHWCICKGWWENNALFTLRKVLFKGMFIAWYFNFLHLFAVSIFGHMVMKTDPMTARSTTPQCFRNLKACLTRKEKCRSPLSHPSVHHLALISRCEQTYSP